VFHVHLEVIPRNPGDGFRLKAKWRTPGRDELDDTAARVRQGITGSRADQAWVVKACSPAPVIVD
jgi:diadenosine tetraphosphate (Ap4A) HIT family hydrolase